MKHNTQLFIVHSSKMSFYTRTTAHIYIQRNIIIIITIRIKTIIIYLILFTHRNIYYKYIETHKTVCISNSKVCSESCYGTPTS